MPTGIHRATWDEIYRRFGTNAHRRELLEGLKIALYSLKRAGCKVVYLDGSFVTSKQFPNDVDCVWEPDGVDITRLDYAFLCTQPGRARQKVIFRGDYFPSFIIETDSRRPFLEFFQTDRETGERKGIVEIRLEEIS